MVKTFQQCAKLVGNFGGSQTARSNEDEETIVVVAVQKRERWRRRSPSQLRKRRPILLTPTPLYHRVTSPNPLVVSAMARSVYSPSPSPSLRSSTDFSDSSDEDIGSYGEAAEYGGSASRPGSPVTADASMAVEDQEADTMTCQWEDCGKVFNHLPTLIDHIHNGEQRPSTLYLSSAA